MPLSIFKQETRQNKQKLSQFSWVCENCCVIRATKKKKKARDLFEDEILHIVSL